MSTPNQLSDTPRTDAAWAKTFQDDEDQCRAGNAATDMRDECATLERELAALAAERDQLRAALALLGTQPPRALYRGRLQRQGRTMRKPGHQDLQ